MMAGPRRNKDQCEESTSEAYPAVATFRLWGLRRPLELHFPFDPAPGMEN